MKATVTIDHGKSPTEWLVTWHTEEDAQQEYIRLKLNVQFAHPSPRISDLERAVMERAIGALQKTLEFMPERQDK